MKLIKTVTAVGCMALMGTLFAPAAKADDWSRKTVVVAIPNDRLKATGNVLV